MQLSTGLRTFLMVTGSLKQALDGTVIKIYNGPIPATADAPLAGNTLLCTITKDGDGVTGLTMEPTAAGGVMTKNTSEVWEGEVIATGEATFFRQGTLADPDNSSNTAIRIQGTVATMGGDINFTDTLFTTGDSRRIRYYNATVPAQG